MNLFDSSFFFLQCIILKQKSSLETCWVYNYDITMILHTNLWLVPNSPSDNPEERPKALLNCSYIIIKP